MQKTISNLENIIKQSNYDIAEIKENFIEFKTFTQLKYFADEELMDKINEISVFMEKKQDRFESRIYQIIKPEVPPIIKLQPSDKVLYLFYFSLFNLADA